MLWRSRVVVQDSWGWDPRLSSATLLSGGWGPCSSCLRGWAAFREGNFAVIPGLSQEQELAVSMCHLVVPHSGGRPVSWGLGFLLREEATGRESTSKKHRWGIQLFHLVSISMPASFVYLLSKYRCEAHTCPQKGWNCWVVPRGCEDRGAWRTCEHALPSCIWMFQDDQASVD